MKHKHRIRSYIIFALIILAFLSLSYFFPGLKKFASPTYVRDFLLSLGNWGYLAFIGLLLLSIPLPMPSTPIVMGGGYVYGIYLGTTLALIGGLIGGTIGFFLIRRYGEPLLEKMVDKHHIVHFTHVFKERGIMAGLISYAIPLFPSDVINLMLGFVGIKYHVFVFLFILGHIPRYLIINSIGNDLHAGFTIQTLIILIIGVILVLTAIFREKLKKVFFKELRFIEEEVEAAEKELEKVEKDVEYIEEGLGIKKVRKKGSKNVKKKIKKRETKKEQGQNTKKNKQSN